MKESEPVKEMTIALQRNLLGSIDLSDIEDKEESEEERRAYCSAIFAVFPRLEKDLKRFMMEQLLFSSNNAETWEQVLFGRGSYNGLSLVYDYWKTVQAEHISNSEKKEDFNKSSPIGEI